MSTIENTPHAAHPAEDALLGQRVRLAIHHCDDNEDMLRFLAHRLWATRLLWAPREWEVYYPPILRDDIGKEPEAPGLHEHTRIAASMRIAIIMALEATRSTAPEALCQLPFVTRCHLLASIMALTGQDGAPSSWHLHRWMMVSSDTMLHALGSLMESIPPGYSRMLVPYARVGSPPRPGRESEDDGLDDLSRRAREFAEGNAERQRAWADSLSELGVAIASVVRDESAVPALSRLLGATCPAPDEVRGDWCGGSADTVEDASVGVLLARASAGRSAPGSEGAVVRLAEMFGAIMLDTLPEDAPARDTALLRVARFVHAPDEDKVPRALELLAAVGA